MGLTFRNVRCETAETRLALDLAFMPGTIIGVTSPDPADLELFGALADGRQKPDQGEVERTELYLAGATFTQIDPSRCALSVRAALDSAAETIVLGPGLAVVSPMLRQQAAEELLRSRQAGRLVIVASQDLGWLERVADEVVVLADGRAIDRGDPVATIAKYRRSLVERLRAAAPAAHVESEFARRGDRRATLIELDLLGSEGVSAARLRSGERATVIVRVRFEEEVEQPVVGILIRNRVGVTVYGTNTELEGVELGPRGAGDILAQRFTFDCWLCPHEYTLTAACHDPEGVAHDWLEEALLFSVIDDRPTAGAANLRAKLEWEAEGPSAAEQKG